MSMKPIVFALIGNLGLFPFSVLHAGMLDGWLVLTLPYNIGVEKIRVGSSWDQDPTRIFSTLNNEDAINRIRPHWQPRFFSNFCFA